MEKPKHVWMGHIDPHGLPLWKPGEEKARLAYEFVRDNWESIRLCAEAGACRSVSILSRVVAESVNAWPAPAIFSWRGQQYGMGMGGPTADVRTPELQAELDASPRNILITTMIEPDVCGQFTVNLDVGPAGLDLADRSHSYLDADQLLATLGKQRADIVAQSMPNLGPTYRKAIAVGCANPVLLTMDLRDHGACAVAKVFDPKLNPKAMLRKGRQQGSKSILLHVASAPEHIAKAITHCGRMTAQRVRTAPPKGTFWLVLVADGRTTAFGLPRELLTA